MSRSPSISSVLEEGQLRLVLSGDWTLEADVPTVSVSLLGVTASPPPARIVFDATALTGWDSRLLMICSHIHGAAASRNIPVDSSGLPPGAARLLGLAAKTPARAGAAQSASRLPFVAMVGDKATQAAAAVQDVLAYVGETAVAVWRLCTGRAVLRSSDVWLQLKQCGADSVAIVSLVSVLVGLILAYVGAVQLQLFGAQVYVSSLVGIAMVRVMGAVMTGVIMAGRIGARFAAELGAMQVNEEIDALKTLGVSPMEFLVLPRLLALVIMLPLLCLYADFMGMLGGFLVGVFMLDIAPGEYMAFTKDALDLTTFYIGLFHSLVFGVLVAMGGCYQGMRCGRSAAAVGQATTAAVVTSVVAIIVATAIITIACDILGL